MNILIIILTGILGLIIGSFLNVVILRINTGRGLGGRSKCFSCNKTLAWSELVPVVSYVIQGGKCRNCRTPISKQYVLVEGATALLFAGVAAHMNVLAQPVTALLWLVLVSLGMIIAVYDIRHYVIPDIPLMLFLGASIAIGLHVAAFVLVPLPFLLLWIVSRGAWIGFGDIELMACAGMLLGITEGIASVVSSFWLACLVILPWYAIQKLRKKNVSHKVPFGPFLLVGMYLVGILGINVLTMITGMVK
jgi:prepilin signal peptidase PulO-like enzyme (type II secretory pathway)